MALKVTDSQLGDLRIDLPDLFFLPGDLLLDHFRTVRIAGNCKCKKAE